MTSVCRCVWDVDGVFSSGCCRPAESSPHTACTATSFDHTGGPQWGARGGGSHQGVPTGGSQQGVPTGVPGTNHVEQRGRVSRVVSLGQIPIPVGVSPPSALRLRFREERNVLGVGYPSLLRSSNTARVKANEKGSMTRGASFVFPTSVTPRWID